MHADISTRVVRFGELVPCRTAFIDAHTPGSDQKENFTIIGAGVSESKDQVVHLTETPGFNIGAAGQPPGCKNSLHSHRTAEVFFVLNGRWRFFWGSDGQAGEVVLEKGDVFNIPTGIFRGFENIGSEYGTIMAILGGDDAGGGVIWAPQVITDAQAHGLILGENGRLYDTKKGESLPAGVKPMPILSESELADFAEPKVSEVVAHHVARYWDLHALAKEEACLVIGERGLLRDKPGFELDFISGAKAKTFPFSAPSQEVLMVLEGHWLFKAESDEVLLNPGDTMYIPAESSYYLCPTRTGVSSAYRVRATDDPAGATWVPAADNAY